MKFVYIKTLSIVHSDIAKDGAYKPITSWPYDIYLKNQLEKATNTQKRSTVTHSLIF